MHRTILFLYTLFISAALSAQTELQEQVKTLERENRELRRTLQELQASEAEARSHYEDIDVLSNIIYKQCLLYPLEQRYNATVISESVQCIDHLRLWNNSKFSEQCQVYYDLLKQYNVYNQEVLALLSEQASRLADNNWDNDAMTERAFRRGLEALTYYPLYQKRNTAPWKSIIFLDNVLEAAEKMIVGDRNLKRIDKNAFNALVAKLQPKQPNDQSSK